jgi:DNA-binding transcriptional regulator YiaG
MNFKELVKEIRVKHNLTQKQLAVILGCNYQTLQRWEYGTKIPSAKYLVKLIELNNKDKEL